jgi:heme/copper-type cytochrome/quinol oxidase subunit 2
MTTFLAVLGLLLSACVIAHEELGLKNFGSHLLTQMHRILSLIGCILVVYAVCAVFLTAFYFCIRGKRPKTTECRLRSPAQF